MSKFKEFFAEAMGTFTPKFTTSGARLGGRLQLTNINALTQAGRAPVGGYGGVGDMVQKRNTEIMYKANYPDPPLQQFKYEEVRQGLYHLAEIATQVDEILQAKKAGRLSGMPTLSIDMAYIKDAEYMPGNDRVIQMIDQRAFTGTYGISTLPTYKIGHSLGVLTVNPRSHMHLDLDTQKLDQAIIKAGNRINSFNKTLEAQQTVGRGIDSIMQRMAQSQGGVQQTPNINPFQG